MKKLTILICTVILACLQNYAQVAESEVSLVVSGQGATKDDATKTALRSAIEQVFGTFVSSHTQIMNEELVKDEIATVSSGNIKSFKYLSESSLNGNCFVTLQAVVSIGKLVAYTQSKGGTTELAGATFAMNMKMKELNKKNENIALNNLLLQLKEIVPQAFDYSINIEDPVAFGVNYHCKAMVEVKPNSNAKSMVELIESTLKSLSLSGSETEEYRNTNIGFTQIYTAPKYVEAKTNCFGELTNDEEKKLERLKFFDRRDVSLREKEIKELSQRGENRKNNPDFSLRTTDTDFFMALNNLLVEAICGFTIADDNGEYQFSAHLADEKNWKSLGRDCSTSSKGRFGINVFGSGSIREIIEEWHENDTGMGWCMINVQTSNTTGNSSRFQRLQSTYDSNKKASLFPLSLNGYWILEGYLNYTAEEIGKISKISVYGLKMK